MFPAASVTFYSCTTNTCGTKTSLGTGTLSSGKATLTTSGLPVGTTYVEAVYGGSRQRRRFDLERDRAGGQGGLHLHLDGSHVLGQPLQLVGQPVTFTATVSSGSGTPSGSVTFYSCTTSTCGTKTSLGTGTLSSGKATLTTSALPVGTTDVEAVYGGFGQLHDLHVQRRRSGREAGADHVEPHVVAQPVDPRRLGHVHRLPCRLRQAFPAARSPSTAAPTNTCGTTTSLGTGTLSSGKATLTTSSLPAGSVLVEAVYGGSASDASSTSNLVVQTVLSVPSCLRGRAATTTSSTGARGTPSSSAPMGTTSCTPSASSYWINGFAGNDCIDVGDGNNVIFDGSGNDAVVGGDGWDTVILGDGNDRVSLGNGSEGVETGDGADTVTVGNGSQSQIIVGNGNDTVTVGSGSSNQIELGRGTDTVTIQSPGSHDVVDGGNGNETVFLGSGSFNTYNGQAHRTNVCHLPKPPASWHGTVAAYYHDTLNNCTVVTP